MGLDASDSLPKGIQLKDAYSAVYTWYRANTKEIQNSKDTYRQRSLGLINALPAPDSATPAEMAVVLGEVVYGNLEWAYHRSDGKYKMAAYAHAFFDGRQKGSHSPTRDEMAQVKAGRLGSHLSR